MTRSLRAPFLLAASSALLALLAAEAALRCIPLAGRGDELRFPVKQDIPGVRRETTYERNGFGFRSVSMRTASKPASTLRVVVLGGSTTDEATHDTGDTWSARLEQAVAPKLAAHGYAVEVLAYGRPGQTIVESLAFARRHLLGIAPDLVISLHGINELAWRGGPGYRYDGSSLAPDAGATWFSRAEDACLGALQLCRRARVAKHRLLIWWALRQGRAIAWQAEELPARRAEYALLPEMEAPERREDPSIEMRDGLRALLAWTRSHHVDAVVLGQPTLWKPLPTEAERARYWFPIQTQSGAVRASPGWMLREMQRYNRIQGEVAAEAGFTFVDLEPILPKDLDHFIDDCHFTLRGSQRVAVSLSAVVAGRLIERVGQQQPGGGRD